MCSCDFTSGGGTDRDSCKGTSHIKNQVHYVFETSVGSIKETVMESKRGDHIWYS